MPERKLAWFGIGLGLVGAGLPLVIPATAAFYVGWCLILVGVGICVSVLFSSSLEGLRLRGKHKTTTKIVRWLHRCADYGTDHIQNAGGIRTSEDVVQTLRPRFDEWNQIVAGGVKAYCVEADAKKIEYLNSYTPRGLRGVTPEHAHIKEMTRETVGRLRELAGRLERGDTQLVPR